MASRLKTQQGNGTVGNATASDDYTLGSNITDLSRAFLILWTTGPDSASYMGTGYLWDDGGTTKVRVEKPFDTDLIMSYSFMVVECLNEEFTVQRGSHTFSGTTSSATVDFGTAVDTTRSLIILTASADVGGGDGNYLGAVSGKFTNIVSDSTDDIYLEVGSGDDVDQFIRYEVIEWSVESGVTVQSGEESLSGDMSSGVTMTAPTDFTAVTAAQTWLFCTFRHESDGLEQSNIRASLTDGSTITFDRYDETTSYQSYATWFLVEFNTSDVVVQHVNDEGASADATESTPLSDITIASSFLWCTNNCNGTGTAYPRNRWWWQMNSTTTALATRVYTGQASQINVQAIDATDWTKDAPPTGDAQVHSNLSLMGVG